MILGSRVMLQNVIQLSKSANQQLPQGEKKKKKKERERDRHAEIEGDSTKCVIQLVHTTTL